MTKVRHYAVNCNDAWRLCPDDPTEGTFVRYEDYKELSDAVIALLTDIRSRYPGQDFTCPHIKLLACLVEGEKEVEDGFKRVEYQGETLDVPEFVIILQQIRVASVMVTLINRRFQISLMRGVFLMKFLMLQIAGI